MAINSDLVKAPPKKNPKSIQYDLFTQFLSNDDQKVSNTTELWECIPKYFFTPKQVEKLRTSTGHSDPYKWEYTYNGLPFIVKIQPALIEGKAGEYKAYFPGVTEELVEEALKKIFTDQNYGIHDANNEESWVRFSLSLIHKELKARGRQRNRNQIKHAIDVMSSCIITLYKDGKEFWKGAILQDLVTVGRKEYLADTDAQHVARLPLFISHSINQLQYRQFNYDRLMRCSEQLTRWIYKQLIHRYRQANIINTYNFMYSRVEQESGLLQQGTASRNRLKVKSALDELKTRGVIYKYEESFKKQGRKITDVKYVVTPTPEFTSEQKASNRRHKDSIEKIEKGKSTTCLT